MPTRYLIIGGGIAGVRAAEQLRRQDAAAEITIVSDDPHLPYDHPPLSKEVLRGDWPLEKADLHPAEFYREQHIALRLGVAAQRIDPSGKTVSLADTLSVPYDKLLIATGSRPRRLTIPGADIPGVHYFRTLADCLALREAIRAGGRAVVIGAGFIGMEVAASLAQSGVKVTVLEVAPYIWGRFLDEALARYFQGYCESRGIIFKTGVAPEEILGKDRATGVSAAGIEYPCDVVCAGIGVAPNTEVAEAAGLVVADGIVVNEYLETSAADVYAAGDAVRYYDPIFEKRRRVEHWGNAEYTGLLAAQNMAGQRAPYGLLSYVWSDIFDLHIEFTGEEKDYDSLLVRGNLQDNSFIVLYLKERRLRAYLAVNAAQRDFLPLQRMIRRRVDLSGKQAQLADTAVELRSLV